MGREMTSSFGIPDSAPGQRTEHELTVQPPDGGSWCGRVDGRGHMVLLSTRWEKWRQVQGRPSPPDPPQGHGARFSHWGFY